MVVTVFSRSHEIPAITERQAAKLVAARGVSLSRLIVAISRIVPATVPAILGAAFYAF